MLLLKIISYKLHQLVHRHDWNANPPRHDTLSMRMDVGLMKAPTLQICQCGVTRVREVR